MSYNLYQRLRAIFPAARLQVGSVTAVDGGTVTVQLPDGGLNNARGSAAIGDQVYIRDGVIEGAAPSLPVVYIEI